MSELTERYPKPARRSLNSYAGEAFRRRCSRLGTGAPRGRLAYIGVPEGGS